MPFIIPRGAAVPVAPPVFTPTLWVNPATGDDSRSKATVAASGGTLPWATLGRAVWGNASRSSPNAGEAAAAGDIVSVAAGSYNFTGTVNDRQTPAYNCTNAGTGLSPITFVANGAVVLSGPDSESPAIGAFQRDYIRWRAETGGSWQITCDPTGIPDGSVNTTTPAGTWNTKPDTGPVVFWDCTGSWIEWATLNGGPQADYADNYNGVRVENADTFIIRYCTILNFRHSSFDNHNGSCITLYGALGGLIENNDFSNAGAGFYFKDTDTTDPQNGNYVRYNRIHDCSEGIAWSLTGQGANYVYQNLVIDCNFGLTVTGGGPQPDRVFNNTFVNMLLAGLYLATPSGTDGGYLGYNNIWSDCDVMVYVNGTMPAATMISLQHNVYQTFTNFYTGTDGNRTFASFKATYTDQDVTAVASVNSDPLFVDAGAGNYRLQGASPAINIGINPNTLAVCNAGCYQTGTETIGV